MSARVAWMVTCVWWLAIWASGFMAAGASAAGASAAVPLKAFPGAEGWGAVSSGGRGGRVIKVTNLNASGPGSLADACAAEGPRIVVFDVSGVIRCNIRITEPYITIAGQTAPGAGITVEGVISSYDYGVHDIIIRHLRVPRWIQFNNSGGEIDVPAMTPDIGLVDAQAAFEQVLAKAGCWPRDRVTHRTIEEVTTQTGNWGRNAPLIPSDEWFLEGLKLAQAPADTDRDGLPDDWEKTHGLQLDDPVDATKIVAAGESDGDRHLGYSYIEFYVNELADSQSP